MAQTTSEAAKRAPSERRPTGALCSSAWDCVRRVALCSAANTVKCMQSAAQRAMCCRLCTTDCMHWSIGQRCSPAAISQSRAQIAKSRQRRNTFKPFGSRLASSMGTAVSTQREQQQRQQRHTQQQQQQQQAHSPPDATRPPVIESTGRPIADCRCWPAAAAQSPPASRSRPPQSSRATSERLDLSPGRARPVVAKCSRCSTETHRREGAAGRAPCQDHAAR